MYAVVGYFQTKKRLFVPAVSKEKIIFHENKYMTTNSM